MQKRETCRAKNCRDDHKRHYCKGCKNSDSDHKSQNCPNLKDKKGKIYHQKGKNQRCNAAGCTQNHKQHFCRVCEQNDSDHRAHQCPCGQILYHGTTLNVVDLIQQNDWKASEDGRLGEGVYFTTDFEVAKDIAKNRYRNVKNQQKGAVLQCILDTTMQNIMEDTHPKWARVTKGEFIEVKVPKELIHRIKIIKTHEV